MSSRPPRRDYVWSQLKRLEEAGLGQRREVSDLRDKFLLEVDHPAALHLTPRPDRDGFVRADTNSLLFRDASQDLIDLVPESVRSQAMTSRKGLEFRWTKLADADIRALFDAVLALLGKGPSPNRPLSPAATAEAPIENSDDAQANSQPGGGSQIGGPRGADRLEKRLAPLLRPIRGQYPRPWMTVLSDPTGAEVMIVGQNQAKTYPADKLTQQQYLDAHFNRNGESCRSLYDELTGGRASPTRKNIDVLSTELAFAGVVETNVICYSTPSAADLREAFHAPGAKHGASIFLTLLDEIRPKVIVLHGAGTIDMARQNVRGLPLLIEPNGPDDIRAVQAELDPYGKRFATQIMVIPSLSPPRFNQWSRWWPDARRRIVTVVRGLM